MDRGTEPLLRVAELRIRVPDTVEGGSLGIRIPGGTGERKGFVFERQRLLIIARLGVKVAEIVERMRQAPLILHRAEDFGSLFEQLERVWTITEAGIYLGDVVQVHRRIPAIVQ